MFSLYLGIVFVGMSLGPARKFAPPFISNVASHSLFLHIAFASSRGYHHFANGEPSYALLRRYSRPRRLLSYLLLPSSRTDLYTPTRHDPHGPPHKSRRR